MCTTIYSILFCTLSQLTNTGGFMLILFLTTVCGYICYERYIICKNNFITQRLHIDGRQRIDIFPESKYNNPPSVVFPVVKH